MTSIFSQLVPVEDCGISLIATIHTWSAQFFLQTKMNRMRTGETWWSRLTNHMTDVCGALWSRSTAQGIFAGLLLTFPSVSGPEAVERFGKSGAFVCRVSMTFTLAALSRCVLERHGTRLDNTQTGLNDVHAEEQANPET